MESREREGPGEDRLAKTLPLEATGETPAAAREPDPLVGRTLGGTEVLALIGCGSMGSVYMARQVHLDRIVALKTIREGLFNDERVYARFREEARTVGRFSTPHVVQVHEIGFEQGVYYLVMEYAGGGNLKSYARKQPGGKISAQDAIRFITQAALGLLEAERLQIVHRDVKAENLLLDAKGDLKIADFGIAKVRHTDVAMTQDCSILGTPLYMSPEQSQGRPLDHRSDLYSLGATFYQLVTGKLPAKGRSPLEIFANKAATARLTLGELALESPLAGSLSRLIENMTARDPADRYPSFRDLLDDVRGIAEGQRPSARRRLRGRNGGARFGRRLLLLGCLSFVVAAAWHLLVRPEGWSRPQAAEDRAGDGTVVAARVPLDRGAAAGNAVASPDAGGAESESSYAPRNAPPAVSARSLPPAEFDRVLHDLESRLASGPSADVLAELGRLTALLPSGPEAAAIEKRLAALRLDVELGLRTRAALETLDSADAVEVAPPYARAAEYAARLRGVLRSHAEAGEGLRRWLRAREQQCDEAIRRRVRASLAAVVLESRPQLKRFEKGEASAEDIRQRLAVLKDSIRHLDAAFPEPGASRPHADLEDAARALDDALLRRAHVAERVGAVEAEAEALDGLLAGPVTTAGPAPNLGSADIRGRLRSLREAAAALRREAPAAALGDLAARMERVEARQRAREGHARRIRDVEDLLASRRLSAAGPLLDSLRADGIQDHRVENLDAGRSALSAGFSALLERLDLDEAGALFGKARESWQSANIEVSWIDACRERLTSLREAVRDMAPIEAGVVVIAGEAEQRRVAAFFIDRFEVSVKEYREFAEEEMRAESFDKDRALWPSEEHFERFRRLPAYLNEESLVDDDWPIEEVNYFQARAFLLRRQKDVPRLAEWWLAARGSASGGGHRQRYPCLREDIHAGAGQPVDVRRGGKSRSAGFSLSTHHLSGNAAEWLEVQDEAARTAQLVGGRYLDDDEACFSGERRDSVDLSESRRGYGFRGVLRPRQFFAGLLPVEP
jgi:tRNA A-37 threonylcarbamoyl transferase component Bud32